MLDQEILSQYNKIRKTKNKAIFCHAPFTSMNFEQNGYVTVCCYNRTYLLGAYPDDTLQEIWYGDKVDRFRKEMKDNVLQSGCDICYAQFESKNFAGLKAGFYDVLSEEVYPEENGRLASMPKVIEFEISNICNLECTMCNGYFSSLIRKNREHLPPLKSPYDKAFVEQLEDFIPHLTEARFLGGEPFLIKTYYRIWDRIIQLNPDIVVCITTNGTVLNERVKGVLERLRAHIIVSIDSLEKESYERIRVGASYDRVMENLGYFRDYTRRKKTDITLAVCPMQDNWRELPHILEYCNEGGIRVFFNTVINLEEASLITMKKDELGDVVEYLGSVGLSEDGEVGRYNNANYLGLIQQIMSYRDKAFEYDEYVSHDSLCEHRKLLELFEGNYRLDESDEINKRINLTISEILKRLANHRNMGDIKVDEEPSRMDSYFIFYKHEKIAQSLESIAQEVGTQRFVREYFNIIKIVIQVLQARGEIIPNDLIGKFDHACEIVVTHPATDLIIKNLIRTDPIRLYELFKDRSMEQLVQVIKSKFG